MRYWKRLNPDNSISTVESYSHDLDVEGAIEITEQEFNDYLASLPVIEPEPPRSTHISTIDAIDTAKPRPVRIKRTWGGRDYFYDCFATQTVKDEFVAGKIAIGDYVLVHFDAIGEQIVTAKVFKSW